MKAKQIKDLATAITNNATVADLETKKHVHTGTVNKVAKSNGTGNFVDSQITDTGSNIAIADAVVDANVLINIETAKSIVKQLKGTKTNGDQTILNLIANAINTGINYGLKISASGSTNDNVAIAVQSGKSIFGGTTGDNSAIVEMISTSKGLLIPQMTTTQKNAIVSPKNGLLIYDTTLNDICVNVGSSVSPSWVGLKAVGVSGSGITGTVPRFNGTSTITNGSIYDNGSTVSIGQTPTTTDLLYLYTNTENALKAVSNNQVGGNGIGVNGIAQGSASVQNFGLVGTANGASRNIGVLGVIGSSILVDPAITAHFAMIAQANTDNTITTAIGLLASAIGGGVNNVGLWIQSNGGTGKNIAILSENDVTSILGGGISDADNSAILQLKSTTKGFLMPRMSTTQKNSIANPAIGLMLFDTTLNQIQINTGTVGVPNWVGVGGTGLFGTLANNWVPRAISSNTLVNGSIYDDGTNVAIGITTSGDAKLYVQTPTTQSKAIAGVTAKNNGDAYGVWGVSNGANTGSNLNVGVAGLSAIGNKLIGILGMGGVTTPDTSFGLNWGGIFSAMSETQNEISIGALFLAVTNNTAKNYGIHVKVANGSTGGTAIMKLENGSDNTGKGLKVINSAGDVDFQKFVETAGSFLSGDVMLFNSSGNAISGGNLYWNGSTGQLTLGSGGNDAVIGTGFLGVDASGTSATMQSTQYSNGVNDANIFAFWKAKGTYLIPVALTTGIYLSERQGWGFDGTSWAQVFAERISAGQNFTGTTHGIIWEMKTITNATSGTLQTRLKIDENGHTRVQNGNLIVDNGQIGFHTNVNSVTTATARTIDFSLGNTHEMDLSTATGTVVITFSNMIDGTPYLINFIQSSTPREVTFAQTVRWSGGSSGKPTFANLTSGQQTLVSVVYLNGKFIASAVVNHS